MGNVHTKAGTRPRVVGGDRSGGRNRGPRDMKERMCVRGALRAHAEERTTAEAVGTSWASSWVCDSMNEMTGNEMTEKKECEERCDAAILMGL